jgi:hypothetical protein
MAMTAYDTKRHFAAVPKFRPFSFSRCSVACGSLQQRCNTVAEQGQGAD